jgi:chemosensory pili system protein ChpA (sensor histidine kinase/response regulator)
LVRHETSYSFSHFNELLGLSIPSSASAPDSPRQVLLLKTLDAHCALAVDEILKTEEIVIKPLGGVFKDIPAFIGATVLGDGKVVPVLDLVHLLKKAGGGEAKKRETGNKIAKTEISPSVSDASFLLSVLIVDDSPSVRQVNLNLIKNAGWQPILARDGVEALEILQQSAATGNLPDVVLTDVEMPRMDGYELLASMKRQPTLRHIPIIMITSRGGDKHRRKAFDLGADDYLTKPYEDSMLLDKISVLAKAR